MNRRRFLITSAAAAAVPAIPILGNPLSIKTRWVVRGSEGFDALSFLSPLSGDPFYLKYYEKEVADFRSRMPADALTTLGVLKDRARAANIMLSPFLDLRFSAGPDATIEDLLHSASDPDTHILPAFQASPYWDQSDVEAWLQFKAALPAIRLVLAALRDAGFPAARQAIFDAKAERVNQLRSTLASFDPISGAEFYTGRRFDPTIEIILLHFCKPHGIKVIGQRFLSALDWSDNVHIRTAGHEILHPPVNKKGPAFTEALAVLERDPLMLRIVKEHDPKWGYNSLEGILDEDLVSAVDQLIAERFGVARHARDRWNSVDDGMHVLSAGLYGLMHQDGYARTGGNLEHWLLNKVQSGALLPQTLHSAAARVLGRREDRLWPVTMS